MPCSSTTLLESCLLTNKLILQSRIKINNLMNHAKALEAIAYNTTGRNRVMGSSGHDRTVKYIYDQLTHPSLGGYYNVTLQPFSSRVQTSAAGSLIVDGKNTSFSIGNYSPSGTFSAPLALVGNLGCNEVSETPLGNLFQNLKRPRRIILIYSLEALL